MSNDAELRARAIETYAMVIARDAVKGECRARDIRSGNLSPEDERAVTAMIAFAASEPSHDGEWEAMKERCAKVAEDAERKWDEIAKNGGVVVNGIPITANEAYVTAGAMEGVKNRIRSLSAVSLSDDVGRS